MRILVPIFLSIIVIVSSCLKKDSLPLFGEKDPIAMNMFCQSSPNDNIKRVEYEYDNGRLVAETVLSNGEIRSTTTFEYNSEHQIITEIYETTRLKQEKTFVYNEHSQLIMIKYKSREYDANGQLINESDSETTFEHEGDQLTKEWQHWGGLVTYEYNDGKIIKKTSYTIHGNQHHITTYQYLDDLLSEEKKETWLGNILYQKTFNYDSSNRLVRVKDGENIIEEYTFDRDELIEKKEFYFGIDPCYAVCCGNYIYRYEY